MKIYLCLFVVFLIVQTGQGDNFENFVRLKLANYSTWLKANDYDPSPLFAGPSHFTVTNGPIFLDCNLRNHGVKGLSEDVEVYQVYTGLEKKWFSVNFYTHGNITFFGDYSATGTLLAWYPIRGNGSWTMSMPKLNTFSFNLYFDETPDGHLKVIDRYFYNVRLNDGDVTDVDVDFEGILESLIVEGYEAYVLEGLFKGLNEYMDSTGSGQHNEPVRAMYLKYWEEVMLESTMEDIIG